MSEDYRQYRWSHLSLGKNEYAGGVNVKLVMQLFISGPIFLIGRLIFCAAGYGVTSRPDISICTRNAVDPHNQLAKAFFSLGNKMREGSISDQNALQLYSDY